MSGQQRISAPLPSVWAALNDPEILKASIPGCQSLELVGDNRFKAAATIKVGPISARFGGVVELSEIEPPRSYRISGEGSGGAAGAARGGALVWLEEDGEGTVLSYEASAEVSGRLAQLGGKLIDVTAKQLAGVFFTRFADQVIRTKPIAAAQPAAAETTSAIAAPAPSKPQPTPPRPSDSGTIAWLLTVSAALAAGFVFGLGATGWHSSGSIAGLALGLLVILVAAAAFLFGKASTPEPPAVALHSATIAQLAMLIRERP